MKMILNRKFLICLCLIFIAGLFETKEIWGDTLKKTIKDVAPEKFANLTEQRIYFGHQSVGYNLIDGIKEVMDEYPIIKLNILETRDLATIDIGVFSHSKIGKNKDPESKTDDFVKIVESSGGNNLDIAFHKYCYIDANATTDVEKVFSNYKKQINYLKTKYPKIRFVHSTMPLTTIQPGLKAWIKKMLGKSIGLEANIKRNIFNQMLINNFQFIDPIFDFASAESMRPDGSMTTFTKDGEKYLTMYDNYSSDGGHLNKLGQKAVAEKLLIFLAETKF